MSTRDKGRRFERQVAARLGGRRRVLSGSDGGGDIDIATLPDHWADFSWETKVRKQVPALITKALLQAQADIALGDPRKPACVIREDRGRAIFVAYLDDIVDWGNALAETGRGAQLRALARELHAIARQMEGMS